MKFRPKQPKKLPPRLQPVDGVSPRRLVELRGEVFLTYAEFARINAARTARGSAEKRGFLALVWRI